MAIQLQNNQMLCDAIHQIAATNDSARAFLMKHDILKSRMTCVCLAQMGLEGCSASRSKDGLVWRCSTCDRTKSIRSNGILHNSKFTLRKFVLLLYHLANDTNSNLKISGMVETNEETIGKWRDLLADGTEAWLERHFRQLGGLDRVVEIDTSFFVNRQWDRGAPTEGTWVVGGGDVATGNCFVERCPGNDQSADIIIPIIRRWVAPGSTVHTDESGSYHDLAAMGYVHSVVDHGQSWVDPHTGTHTNTQEGLWSHIKAIHTGSKYLRVIAADYMFRKRVNATSGKYQLLRTFNGYVDVLKEWNV